MRPTVVTLFSLLLVSLISVLAVAAGPGPYPMTVTLAPLPPTSAALQGKGCSYNCYSGDVECKSRQARNFQLAEGSDGNTYELRCVSDLTGAGCPVAFGTYQARRVKQGLQVLVPGGQTSKEQTFSIVNERPSKMTSSSAEQLRRCRELLAEQQ